MSDADYQLIRSEESAKFKIKSRSLMRAMSLLFLIGLLFAIVSTFYTDDMGAFIFFLGAGFAMMIGSVALYFWAAGMGRQNMEIAIDQRVEEARLEFLKSKMTVAEWENYKLQLENNALLKNIKANQNRKANQGPGISYGIIDS